MTKKTILYAFIVVCVLYFFSSLLQLDSLEVLTKPLFLPILFWYYIKKVKGNFQYRVVVSFVFYYIAEMLTLNDSEEFYLLSVFLFLIPYLILLNYIIKDLLKLLKINSLNKINFIILFVIAFLAYLLVSIFLIIDTASAFEQILLYTYGFILLVLSVCAVVTYILRHSVSNLFLVMTAITFVASDMFYIFIVKIEYNWVFKSVNLISQLLSYYFFVTYSLLKQKDRL